MPATETTTPSKPTPEMAEAGAAVLRVWYGTRGSHDLNIAEDVFRAMLAARSNKPAEALQERERPL
jgi:hypothetical protein